METLTCKEKSKSNEIVGNRHENDITSVSYKQEKRFLDYEMINTNDSGDLNVDVKLISNAGNQLLFKARSKTPKPPDLPRSTAFRRKSSVFRQEYDDERDCVEDDDIDYSCIERSPGDGCFSECTEEDFEQLSDCYYDDELLEEGINLIEDESDELSNITGSSESRPSTAALQEPLHREKLVHTLKQRSTKIRSANVDSRGHWIAYGTEEVQPALTSSLFPNMPGTIHFTVDGERVHPFPSKIKKHLKWKMSPITPNVVKLCIARSGFLPTKKNDWLGYWGRHMKATGFKAVREYQKVNHFPGSFQIGRKDKLWKNLSKLLTRHGRKEFGFIPQTFILPQDFRIFKRVWEDGGNRQKWILKPPASARGIGVRVVNKWSQIPKKKPVVVQKYLTKPYLINGRKFDLRIYVFVTSFDPLRIYLFEDGLARFATCKYTSSSKSLGNRFMHLTNYSINKKNNNVYTPNDNEEVCQGHKWSLKALWGYLKRSGVNTSKIWENIKDIVVKTVICCESTVNVLMKQNVRNSYCCNELFGFDVMLDENLKPWILEVNISPSLHSTSPLDMSIKGQMVRDLLNISGYKIPDNLLNTAMRSSSFNNPSSLDKGRFALTSDQKAKHGFYVNNYGNDRLKATILDILTPEDIKILAETEDEYSRRGCFQRIFPSETSQKYLTFFDSPRYRNILLDEWTKKYLREGHRTAIGVALLCTYTQQGIHLRSSCYDLNHQWVSPQQISSDQSYQSPVSRSLSAPASTRLLENYGISPTSQISLPKIKRKTGRSHASKSISTKTTSMATKKKCSNKNI
ncbi:tubulin monoglutamylase TTLL4-like [Xenia sp. Carnegie-2017]|uniref:tubulin monoglutamylase TTLL4-like n=1 Tax=Xenia sp. Carnegie-2017 TaxID=2897299 RepID=UPI001F034A33|nr:tubulin monoglutamylase TTLL4-like [Xenia sp. Carnegie-2017]XP_046846126.1 tubulin monoglutamylase TTLL4-like [Xenia sp. Carnegie-2017]